MVCFSSFLGGNHHPQTSVTYCKEEKFDKSHSAHSTHCKFFKCTTGTYFLQEFQQRFPWFWLRDQVEEELLQMMSALVHQAALLICESEVEWHLISTHQHMAYRTCMMSMSFLFKSSKFITTYTCRAASSFLKLKHTVKIVLKLKKTSKY